jgi:predicted component of type VI protein secretion system
MWKRRCRVTIFETFSRITPEGGGATMSNAYYSERERGSRPRIHENIEQLAWGGIIALVKTMISNKFFGADFAEECPDGRGPIGNDEKVLGLAIRGDIPGIQWPLEEYRLPSTLEILDLIEFCHRHVAKPTPTSSHSYFGHDHLSFDRQAGQAEFRERINEFFVRNGLIYELQKNGQVIRFAPPILEESLRNTIFSSGDHDLDIMLETARAKFLNPDPGIRRESLEKLWDAWERLKTLEPGKDKKASIEAMLYKASQEQKFRETLDKEARELTSIGNSFQIRHTETNQTPLTLNEHVDYLFHRLFALILLCLRRNGS